MNLDVAELNSEVVGKRLGMSLYNSAGKLLLKKGIVIEPNFYSHLKDMGYRSIYLLGGDPESQAISEGISERMLASMSAVLRNMFAQLRHEGQQISAIRNDLVVLAKSFVEIVRPMGKRLPRVVTLKRQDDYLYQHSVNVAAYSILIGRHLRYDESKLLKLALSALLYDIGMEFVKPEIVNKETDLAAIEFEEVKKHTRIGFRHLVTQCAFDASVGLPAMQHHERLDGGGYPNCLSGGDIHEYSRIISISDFLDAWTSDRPHRRMNSIDDAFGIIKNDKGRAFDQELAGILMDLFEP